MWETQGIFWEIDTIPIKTATIKEEEK